MAAAILVIAGAQHPSPCCRRLAFLACKSVSSDCYCSDLLDSAISKYTQLLSTLQPGACSGLYACLLLKRAVAHSQKQEYDAALQSLNCGLGWEPESADCLQLRAEVWLSEDVKPCYAYFMFCSPEKPRHACMHEPMHKLCTSFEEISRWSCLQRAINCRIFFPGCRRYTDD